jgi:hypothetical protein
MMAYRRFGKVSTAAAGVMTNTKKKHSAHMGAEQLKRSYRLALGAVLCLSGAIVPAIHASAKTISAASCAHSDVQRALSRAGDNDTVAVPAGRCVWQSFEIDKAIDLRGEGSDSTHVSLEGTVRMVKSSFGNVELSGFSFTLNRKKARRMFVVDGHWDAEPPLIHDNVFDISDPTDVRDNAGILLYGANGGVIYNNVFRGNWDDSGIQHKLVEDNVSWSVADTIGIRDTDGKHNLYVEDNIFEGMANQATDFDDHSRIVFRYNVLRNASFNTHGLATSPVGIRHFEIYNNAFGYPDNTVNQTWHIWLRGGTGVVYGNYFDDIKGQMYGDNPELHLSVRAMDDGSPEGCCTKWPCKHQLGQNFDGRQQFLDTIRIWGNSGTLKPYINTGWSNECGQDIEEYLIEGREFMFANSPKYGYEPYPYPHPLRATHAH